MSKDRCDVEAEELIDAELGEGDGRLVFLGGKTASAGDNNFPLPSIRPPPSLRDDIFHSSQSFMNMTLAIHVLRPEA